MGHATTSIDRGNGWLAAAHEPYVPVRILITAVVFSSKSRSDYVLNPDLLSEVHFCRLCAFVLWISEEKKNKVEFPKMFESGWCECFGGR